MATRVLPAVTDAVRLYRLVLEKGKAGARYHAVGEEGVALHDIAEVIGAGLKMPVESIAPEGAGVLRLVGEPLPDRSCSVRRADAPTAGMERHRARSADRPAQHGLQHGLGLPLYLSS